MGKGHDDEFTALRINKPRITNTDKFCQLIGIGGLLCRKLAKGEPPALAGGAFTRVCSSQGSKNQGGLCFYGNFACGGVHGSSLYFKILYAF
jgi:hypothetical protein